MQSHGAGTDKLYVAVVDDDESVCRSFSRLLRVAGFEPIAYGSAEAFLEDTKHPRFDCLVLDIQLGGMTGLELAGRLKEVRRSAPCIFITAHDDPEARTQAMACGCAGYFRKNDSGQLVIDAIREAVHAVHGKAPKPPSPTRFLTGSVTGNQHHEGSTSPAKNNL